MKTRVIQDDSKPAENGIDRGAPVLGSSETEVDAAPELVWDVLTEIERWPAWNPDVRSVSMAGDLAEGSQFHWKAGPGTIRSTLERVERPGLISWSGRTFGIDARHVYVLEARNGKTFVRTEETYDGLVARLLRGRLQRTLDQALESGLRHLKAEAERRTTHPAEDRRS